MAEQALLDMAYRANSSKFSSHRAVVDCLDAYLYRQAVARPRSDAKRTAILNAAARIIVTQGLSAPTAGIAKEAGVANGSLFTYFVTKADLFNQLYLELKTEMATAASRDLGREKDSRVRLLHVWQCWTVWAVANPDKRRVLAQLEASEVISPATRTAGHHAMASLGELLQRIRERGPLRNAPMAFVVALMNSIAETTIAAMAQDEVHAKLRCDEGFDALWRVVA